MKHLIKLIQDLEKRCSYASKLPYTDDLKGRLQSLTNVEKFVIADFVYKLEYDIGTGRILELLQETHIISVQHYVTRIEDTPLVLNIYNDFLETHPKLFAELVKGATQKCNPNSVQLKATLEDFLEDFVQDLQGLKSNPFKAMADRLDFESGQYLNETLLGSFMRGGAGWTIERGLSEQHAWHGEEGSIQKVIIRDCLRQMTSIETVISFIHRFVLSRDKAEINWKTYCQVLRSVARLYGSKVLPIYRRILSDDFKTFTKDKNEFLLHLTMITIRQLSLAAPNEIKYGEWYKMNIGEMMYTMDKEDFRYVMKVLTKLIEHEGSKDFLTVHINTRIQAPPMCNDIVFTYKALLRSRLDSLGKEKEVIEIDV